jgi:hypothetical protein
MDLHEFMHRADSLIERLGPRIDARQAGFIRDNAHGGDWDEAIDNLIATLTKNQVPITTAEHAELFALLAFMKRPDSPLDGLAVTAPPTTPPTPGPDDLPTRPTTHHDSAGNPNRPDPLQHP